MVIDDIISLDKIEKNVNSVVSRYLHSIPYHEKLGHKHWIAVKQVTVRTDLQIPETCNQNIYVEFVTDYPKEMVDKILPDRIVDNVYVHYIFKK